MKKIVFYLICCYICHGYGQQQNVTFSVAPNPFSENDEITITVSDIDPNTWGVSDLYVWAWYTGTIGGDSPTNGTWENSDESQKLTNNGDGTYSYTFTPTTFYNATGIESIGMLVKAKDGTGDNKTQDFIVSVGAFQLTLNSPENTQTILDSGDDLTFAAISSLEADFVLYANGVIINSSTQITEYNYTHSNIIENTSYTLEVTSDNESIIRNFNVLIRPSTLESPVPDGLINGLNVDPNDNTKATLVLYAPNKEFVHVMGDFNNWQVDDSYLMLKDNTTDRFWLELTGLTPQNYHLYQYMVEYQINIADPYSTLILDGYGNDSFIDDSTFPDLPEYPAGQSESISVFKTAEEEYIWETTNYERPEKNDLVIYELLIRDFDELHTFNSVKNRLDYLEDLGINAIELMPVNEFDGNESWGYNPAFHMALDKYYGTKNDFKSFIDACHARGIAVIIDVVYNHGTGQHPYYRMWNTDNGGTGGQASNENPFFNPTPTHSYSVFNDFNHQSQPTKDYVKQTVEYWINEYKIDGMRWDLTKGFTQNCSNADENCTNSTQTDRVQVLQEYADYQWNVDPDFFVIFEHLGGIQEEEQWADYRVDEGKGILLWNKLTDAYNDATMGYHDSGTSNFSGVSYLQRGFSQPSTVSYMESHDEERLMYKNLEFGNSNTNYDVTNLNTALKRMELAGAFFFTVPGPKMIWQFGELGYDISIDQNGRVGNKPILWEYENNTNRKNLYDQWSDLIKLKLGEPIFNTAEFSLNLGSADGLKTIHLANPSALANEIKNVTIIGNFGLTEQAINPAFQTTGVWYEFLNENLKHIVTNVSSTITLAPGEFRIYGDNPSTLFPNNNPADQDNDGVVDMDDLCPNTVLGASVDITGCPVFTLPNNNFSINIFDETCRSSNNGSISIFAIEDLNYTATLSGGATASENFTNSTEFSNLSTGSYTVCITVEGESDYEQCYNVNISEPEDLSVSSKVDLSSKKLTLELNGGNYYNITLNNTVFTTSESEITLDLNQQSNVLKIATDKECQGVFEETILLNKVSIAYPNPVQNNSFNIILNDSDESAQIEVFNILGKLISNKTYTKNNGAFVLDTSKMSHGLYLVKVYSKNNMYQYKMIK